MTAQTEAIRKDAGVPETPVRTLRVDDELWKDCQKIAAERRETLSAVLKRALVEYREQHKEQA
jgi:predicted transcriptional regulator